MSVLATLEAHSVFIADADEQDLTERAFQFATDGWEAVLQGREMRMDVADLALRTCLCGTRIDGFDEYVLHLQSVLRATN